MPRKTFICNGIRAVIVLFMSFFILICEADFLEENYLIFVGSEALGNINVLTPVTLNRGRLKLRCSSECLKKSACSGVRIDLNSSECLLLIGQFTTLENLESHYRFYKRAGVLLEATTSSTQQPTITSTPPQLTETLSTQMSIPTTENIVCSDCECVGAVTSGVYEITVNGQRTSVYCQMLYGFDWMVIFRRTIGDVLFNKVWSSYTTGFGNINGDFWLGLDNISSFTSAGWSVMRVEMEDDIGNTGYAQYGLFLVGGSTSEYKLTVSQYSGNAGYDAFSYHDNMKFSTKDHDNDLSVSINCASYYGEPWWNDDCARMKFTRDNFNELG
ncbi:fibroleukin-like [Crassostrea virginica]